MNISSCPTDVMRFLFIAILFVLTTRSWAQFDRINSDPLNLHASFAGSSGGHRFSNEFSLSNGNKIYPSFTGLKEKLSYDVLIPKLKGGIGISLSIGGNNQDRKISNSVFQGEIAYAPKFTFSHPEVTWSPSVRVGYFTLASDAYNPKVYGSEVSDRDVTWFSLGLLRNSRKTFYGIEYLHGVHAGKNGYSALLKSLFGIKFNKSEESYWSSTLVGLLNWKIIDDHGNVIFPDSFLTAEYHLKYRSLLFIGTTQEAGLGIKRKNWGINARYSFASPHRFNFGFTYSIR